MPLIALIIVVIAFLALMALLPLVLAASLLLLKWLVICLLIGSGIFIVAWVMTYIDPRERAIRERQKQLDEELAARNAARAAAEKSSPQPSA